MSEEDPSQAFTRFFTLDEANSLIPQFTDWMGSLRLLHRQVVERMEQREQESKGNGRAKLKVEELRQDLEDVTTLADHIKHLADKINATGAIVKDLDLGLVDFPHFREGRVVYLCWMHGEPHIGFWHETNEGATGRQPI